MESGLRSHISNKVTSQSKRIRDGDQGGRALTVLSVGLVKSGTTLLYQYTLALMANVYPPDGQKALRRLIREGKLEGIGDFVQRLDERALDLILELAEEHGPLVVKSHTVLTPKIREVIESGYAKATFTHRDPRDVILSAMDHRKKSINTDRPAFEEFTSVEESIPRIKNHWWPMATEWIRSGCASVHRYVDLLGDPYKELKMVCRHLEIDPSRRAIRRIIKDEWKSRQYGRRQFNTGRLVRFRDEMSQDELTASTRDLSECIADLGYEA